MLIAIYVFVSFNVKNIDKALYTHIKKHNHNLAKPLFLETLIPFLLLSLYILEIKSIIISL